MSEDPQRPEAPQQDELGPGERALTRLRADEALRRRLAKVAVDAFLARAAADVVDREGVVRLLTALITETHARQLQEELGEPGFARTLADARDEQVTLGGHLSEAQRQELHDLIDSLRIAPAEWRRGLVDAGTLRQLLAPVLQQTLVSFAQRLVGSLGGIGSGIGSVAGGLAGGLAGALGGRRRGGGSGASSGGGLGGLAGALGGRLEAVAKDTARDFASVALDELDANMRARLASAEGRALLRALVEGTLGRVLDAPLAEVLDDLEVHRRRELQDFGARAAIALFHSDFGRAGLERELRALVELLGGRTVHELLREAEVLSEVRAWLRTQVEHTLTVALDAQGEELAAIFQALFA